MSVKSAQNMEILLAAAALIFAYVSAEKQLKCAGNGQLTEPDLQ